MPVDVSDLQAQNSNDFRLIDLDQYTNDVFTLLGYKLSSVLDDILLVQYADLADETGDTVMRNGVAIPLAHVQKAWRIGQVVLAGPRCRNVAQGDYICFPSDKGIIHKAAVSHLDDKTLAVFEKMVTRSLFGNINASRNSA